MLISPCFGGLAPAGFAVEDLDTVGGGVDEPLQHPRPQSEMHLAVKEQPCIIRPHNL